MNSLLQKGDGKVHDYFDEMGLDMATNSQVTTNFELLMYLNFYYPCLVLPLLKKMHAFIKFSQSNAIFIFYFVIVMKIYQS